MKIEIVSILCGGTGFSAPGIGGDVIFTQIDNKYNNQTPCQIYQHALQKSMADIIIYAHDDVEVYDPAWMDRIVSVFNTHRDCAAVGFGGAPQLGQDNLYKKPFDIWNMARSGYMSNQRDWATHGAHETGVRRVAVLDAFLMAVRLDQFMLYLDGQWPVSHLTHHCLDLWLACELARHGCETYMTGVDCLHKGGGSSTKPQYGNANWLQGGTLELDHLVPHVWLANEYRDVLPIKVAE